LSVFEGIFVVWLVSQSTALIPSFSKGEQKANLLGSVAMARRPDRDKADILSERDIRELRHNLAHLSIQAVRDFYDQAYGDCRLIYHRLPSPKQMQTLVQVWKQLWKWR
jgi:hypothetical protein